MDAVVHHCPAADKACIVPGSAVFVWHHAVWKDIPHSLALQCGSDRLGTPVDRMPVGAAVVVGAHMRCIVVEVVAVAGALQLVRSQNMGPLENTQTHCRLMPDVDLVANHKLR
jgi:hypothetical protein